jgi:hypothetical protein
MVGEDIELVARHQAASDAKPYERLLHDAIDGEMTLFARQDEVEEAWRVVQPILDDVCPIHPYKPGTYGPAASDEILADVGGWRTLSLKEPPTRQGMSAYANNRRGRRSRRTMPRSRRSTSASSSPTTPAAASGWSRRPPAYGSTTRRTG